jgi:hypothetical protein
VRDDGLTKRLKKQCFNGICYIKYKRRSWIMKTTWTFKCFDIDSVSRYRVIETVSSVQVVFGSFSIH